jgi:hypothetical protein
MASGPNDEIPNDSDIVNGIMLSGVVNKDYSTMYDELYSNGFAPLINNKLNCKGPFISLFKQAVAANTKYEKYLDNACMAYVEDCQYNDVEYNVPDSFKYGYDIARDRLKVHLSYSTDVIACFSHVHQNGLPYNRGTDEVFVSLYNYRLRTKLEVLRHLRKFWMNASFPMPNHFIEQVHFWVDHKKTSIGCENLDW